MLFVPLILALVINSAFLAFASLATSPPYNVLQPRDNIAPLMPAHFPDPAIFKKDGTSYLFATGPKGGTKHISLASAPQSGSPVTLLNKDALPNLPPWVAKSDPSIWAPDIAILPSSNTFILYYSARSASHPLKHCIGAASSLSITGPYSPLDSTEAFIEDFDGGGAIDPAPVTDGKKMYVVYKVDGNGLDQRNPAQGACRNGDGKFPTPFMLQEVDPEDGVRHINEPRELIRNKPEDGAYIEAPSIARHESGPWIMTFSSHCFRTVYYDVQYATAPAVNGPWTRRGQLLKTGDFGLNSPGGASLTDDATRIVFHADVKAGDPSLRQLYSMALKVEGNVLSVIEGSSGTVGPA